MKSTKPALITVGMGLFLSPLFAHPDHSVTQKGVVEPVPANRAAPAESEVEIWVEGDVRFITANGIPDHETGRFPNNGNPNRISEQSYWYMIPAAPVEAERPTPLVRQPFGIALNGVVFDPGTAEAWQNNRQSGWSYDALGGAFSLGLDTNHGHVQRSGAYHYHGLPQDLLNSLSGGKDRMTLMGWAADGFPIYGKWGYADPMDEGSGVVALASSYQLKAGQRPTANGAPGGTYDGVFVEDFEYVVGKGDLDICGGRYGVTPEFPEGTYYYVLTEDFPFVPRYFKGSPDESFARRGGQGDRPPRGGGRGTRTAGMRR